MIIIDVESKYTEATYFSFQLFGHSSFNKEYYYVTEF